MRGGEQMNRILDRMAVKFGHMDIPIKEEEWETFPKTRKGKFSLLVIQCVLAVITSLITMRLLSV